MRNHESTVTMAHLAGDARIECKIVPGSEGAYPRITIGNVTLFPESLEQVAELHRKLGAMLAQDNAPHPGDSITFTVDHGEEPATVRIAEVRPIEVGDKVRCIDSSGREGSIFNGMLAEVQAVKGDFILVAPDAQDNPTWEAAHRFRLEPAF